MSLAYLFDSNIQFQDRSGNNNVNGFLRVYIDNTDDRAVTYKDFNGTLNQADIRLDNNGRAVVIVDDSKTYRLEVYGTTGVLLWTLYPISPKATGINETLEALVAAVKSHTIAIEGLALGKKNKQQAKVISGNPTQTVKSISQNADGEITVEFEDIAFPHKVLVDNEDSNPKYLEDAIMADENGLIRVRVDEEEDSTPENPNKVLVIDDSELREEIDNNEQRITNLEETIDELDMDSVPHAYLNSTLNHSAGDSTTTRTTVDVFAYSALVGDCFEFEQTATIDDTPFGYIWVEPGTYLINGSVTLQWVGDPRGTFVAKVGSVMGENFDFSQEQEILRNHTKIVTIPNRMKLAINITYDAGTPVMGFWIQSLQVVKLAGGMSQTNVAHDDTLVGQGSVSDPLGVDKEAIAQSTLAEIKNLPTTIASFRQGDVILVDGPNGPAKMDKDTLLQLMANTQELYGFAPNAGMTLSDGVGSTVDNYAHRSNGYYYYETACLARDTFIVVGAGGEGLRLWAFLDSSRKILSVASSNTSANDGVIIKAPSDGFLCVNCTSDSGRVFKVADNVTKNTDKIFIRDYAELGRIDILDVSDGAINTNVGFGNVVTFTPEEPSVYGHQVVNVAKGDRFFVSGRCGTKPRLWAFVDSSDRIVSFYAGDETGGITESEIDAPFDGKLIVNFAKAYPHTLAKIDLSAYLEKREKFSPEITKRVDDVSAVDLTNWCLNSNYDTSGAIGSVVTMSPTKSNVCKSLVTSCKAGDKFIVKGTGATNPRLWCFVDSANKIVSHANAAASFPNGVELVAKVDGKLIINIVNTSSVYKVIALISDRVYPIISKAVDDCKTLALVQKNDWVNECYIKTNLNYGDTVSLTPVTSGSYRHMVVDCKAGDAVYVKAYGGEAPRSWAFIDSSNVLVSSINGAVPQSDLLKIYAPVDGKLIVNDYINSGIGLVLVSDASKKQEMLANFDERIATIENELPPNTLFKISHELPNVASYISGFDYSTTALQKTILEQVYTAFDDLVTDYPDYVSRVDAAEEAGIDYPEYANGYDGVPAYKMYMYKFVSSFVGAGNENGVNPKKKLFIIAGVHGNEIAAPADAYIFAKKLCEASEDNFFKLRTCYDVYIIPCVNGFGLYKLTRVNGTGVDLNRNFPIEHWHVTGEPGDSNYSGASAGSEFETQVVCATFASIGPNVAVDHHNYSESAGGQFYMASNQKFMTKIAHQFLEDCSFTFIKDLPEYFGTAYQLFKKNVTNNLPASVAPPNDATSDIWFTENGVECGMTVEMSNCINYYEGEAVSVGQGQDVYGTSTFSVGQYTFAGILFKVAGYLCVKNP